MYRSVYCGIEVCIASWVRREMMGLWFGSPTFGYPAGWYATRRRLGGGTLGCVPIPTAPGLRNNIARAASEDQASRLSIHPTAWKDLSPRFIFRCMHLIYR